MKRRMRLWILMLTCFCVLAGCAYKANTVKTSYQALAVSQQTYDGAMTVFGELVRAGEIEGAVKADVLEVAHVYYQAHNSAVTALIAYKQTESAADLVLVEQQVDLVANALSDLMEIIKPYLTEE